MTRANRPPLYARRRWLLLRVLAGVALVATVIALVGPAQLAATIGGADSSWLLLALCAAIGANALSAWRWQRIAGQLGIALPFQTLFGLYLQGISVNTVLPGATLGGDALRAMRLAGMGHPLRIATLSVVADRVGGLWILLAIASLVGGPLVLLAPANAPNPMVGLWLLSMLAWAMLSLPMMLPPGHLHRDWLERVRSLAASVRRLLPATAPLSVAVQIASAATLWACAAATGADIGFAWVLVLSAPIFLAAAVPASIAGFGPREAAALAFPAAGVSAEAGVGAAVLYGSLAAVQGLIGAPLLLRASIRTRSPVEPPDPASPRDMPRGD